MRLLPLILLFGCPPPSTPTVGPEPVCTSPMPPACPLADLAQHDAVSEGLVTTVVEGNNWIETVDARAGGLINAADNPWIYIHFGDDGMEKVAITDLQALESMDWDLALHRFNIRLNSGTGGPSCVQAGPVASDFDAVDLSDADQVTFSTEAFYDDSCTFQSEASGQEGEPEGIPTLVLKEWWTYPDCVATTGTPFLIRVANGRTAKLEVLAYYGGNQQICNNEGQSGTDAALYTIKWTWLT